MRKGFTLIELSIVLVVIGLLVGGVLTAESMITTQKINRLGKDLQQVHILTNQFRERYRYLPGDVPNGYDLFGGVACGNAGQSATWNRDGCNGNGDGVLNWAWDNQEVYLAWEHLYRSGMVNVPYEANAIPIVGGPADGKDSDVIGGVNVMLTSFVRGKYRNYKGGIGFMGALPGGYMLMVGSVLEGGCTPYCDGIMWPAEMAALDAKFDDKVPNTGKIQALSWQAECTDGGSNYSVNRKDPIGCTVTSYIPEQYE